MTSAWQLCIYPRIYVVCIHIYPCLYMFIYKYTFMYLCIHTWSCVCVQIYMCGYESHLSDTCAYICAYIHVHKYTYPCIYICISICIYPCIYAYIRVRLCNVMRICEPIDCPIAVHMFIFRYMFMYIYVYIHIWIYPCTYVFRVYSCVWERTSLCVCVELFCPTSMCVSMYICT